MKRWSLAIGLFLLASCSPQQTQPFEDNRQYAHGVSIIGNSVLWSEKSEEQRKNGWTHDIYKKEIGQAQIKTLIGTPEAQEPVSASSTKETILLTYEDGYDTKNNVSQRFKLYDHKWKKLHEATLFEGGHSGHVSSTNTHHVIFWSHDWINGGGVNELGSGKEVIVSTVSNDGELMHEIKLSQADDRDSWPLLAASDDNALLVWQHFNDKATKAALYFAVYHPATNALTVAPSELLSQIDFYKYSISYVQKTKQYVVAAQTNEGGTLILLSKDGEILDQVDAPDLVKESSPAVQGDTLVFPQLPDSYFIVKVSDNQLQIQSSNSLDVNWGLTGTAGSFVNESNVYFATLNKEGLQEVFVEIDK